jgi:Zn-dependent protease with chaperone function
MLVDWVFMPRSDRLSRQRRIDGYAVAAIIPVIALLPAWLAAVAVFWWVIQLFVNVNFWLFATAWLAAGVVLFLRPTQKLVLTRLLGARTPTRSELDRLQRAWNIVAQANHIPPNRFVFAVVDSDDLNAFASGGHLVVVSSWAIDSLSRDDLTGVLAHELSHHLGMHTVALAVGQWLSIPIILLARIGFFFQNIAHAATDTFARRSAGASFVGKTVAGALTIVAWLFLSMITVSQMIGNATGKGAEFKADETVVSMGFGKQLRNALRIVIAAGNGERAAHWRDRLVTAHPPARTRVARIEAQLRKTSRDNRR